MIKHFQERTDVQNIDVMEASSFDNTTPTSAEDSKYHRERQFLQKPDTSITSIF